MDDTQLFGLDEHCITTIKTILKPWAHKIERVAIFGSRATGTYRDNSDIDLVVYGSQLSENDINRLWTLLNESNIPYKIDLNAYHLIEYPPFKSHIDTVNKTLFNSGELSRS